MSQATCRAKHDRFFLKKSLRRKRQRVSSTSRPSHAESCPAQLPHPQRGLNVDDVLAQDTSLFPRAPRLHKTQLVVGSCQSKTRGFRILNGGENKTGVALALGSVVRRSVHVCTTSSTEDAKASLHGVLTLMRVC